MNLLGTVIQEFMLANGAWPTIIDARTQAGLSVALANTQRDALVATEEAHVGTNGRIRIRPPARTVL